MRGNTLGNILSMVKAEVGDFSGTNSSGDQALRAKVLNMQSWLATEYEWPFLAHRWDQAVAPNTQYLTFPTSTTDPGGPQTANINFERIPKVSVFYNTQYFPVGYGIGDDEYNFQNFALGQASDPIRKWRMASNPNEPAACSPNSYEVWPVPVTQQTLRFFGQRQVQALQSNLTGTPATDNALIIDLDDTLVMLFVAAEEQARAKQADAEIKMGKAQRRLAWVRSNYPTRSTRRVLGHGTDDMGPTGSIPEGVKLVAIH